MTLSDSGHLQQSGIPPHMTKLWMFDVREKQGVVFHDCSYVTNQLMLISHVCNLTYELDTQLPYRRWRGRNAMRSNWPRSMGLCPPSSSRGRHWRTPTLTPRCSRIWDSLQRPWRLHTKTCKSNNLIYLLFFIDVGTCIFFSSSNASWWLDLLNHVSLFWVTGT